VISTAKLRYLRSSAQKVRLVVDQVRGRKVEDALAILHYSPKGVARDIEKLMNSAVANAQQKDPKLDVDDLFVSRALVDEAPPMKRIRHRAMGRVFQIRKRSCHVTIDLDIPNRETGDDDAADRR
jgi:large subunit ribosomal protein L22